MFFSIRRITINQKQTPYTITTEEINVSSENEGFDADGNFDICNDDNSNMNSNNNISTKKNTTQSMEQLSTQLGCYFQLGKTKTW